MEYRVSYAPVRENVPVEQYDNTQMYAFGLLKRMYGSMPQVPDSLAVALSQAITPKQVRCMVREYGKHGNVARRAPFTIASSSPRL